MPKFENLDQKIEMNCQNENIRIDDMVNTVKSEFSELFDWCEGDNSKV